MNSAEDLVKDKNRDLISVPTGTTIADALALMAAQNIGCLLVTDKEKYVGIWTERDFMRNMAQVGITVLSQPIDAYMSHPLYTCDWNDSVYKLMDKFLGLRIRHLLVKKNDQFIGLLSAGDVMKASIRAKNQEIAKLNATMGWAYYEEWRISGQ